MFAEFFSVLSVAGETMLKIVPVTIALGVVFALLSQWSACNPGQVWWRKREIVTDVLYWFLIPLMARFVRIGLMVMGAAYIYGIHGTEALVSFYDDGFGPLARLPLWAQALAFLVAFGRGAVLVSPPVSRRAHVEVPRHPSFVGRARLDLGGALSPGQHSARHGDRRRGAAARRHFAQRHAVGRPLHDRAFGLRPRQSQLDLGSVEIRPCQPGLSSLAPHGGRSRRLEELRRHISDLGYCCSAPGTCRRTQLPDAYGVDDKAFPESFGAQMLYPFKQ